MVQFGPYGPNHATAATFAFWKELLTDLGKRVIWRGGPGVNRVERVEEPRQQPTLWEAQP
jgi:hypothetical protein